MKEIATRPNRSDWIAYGVLFPMVTAIGALVPFLVINYCTASSPTGCAPLWAIGGALVFGALVAFWFVRQMVNRHYWRLSEAELIGGRRGQISLPLSSVEKIILGLPAKPISGTEELTSPLIWQHFVIQKKISLLVVFRDQSLLPLNLHAMPNGTALMTELVTRLKDRIEQNHVYNSEEIRRLRGVFPNVLVRRK